MQPLYVLVCSSILLNVTIEGSKMKKSAGSRVHTTTIIMRKEFPSHRQLEDERLRIISSFRGIKNGIELIEEMFTTFDYAIENEFYDLLSIRDEVIFRKYTHSHNFTGLVTPWKLRAKMRSREGLSEDEMTLLSDVNERYLEQVDAIKDDLTQVQRIRVFTRWLTSSEEPLRKFGDPRLKKLSFGVRSIAKCHGISSDDIAKEFKRLFVLGNNVENMPRVNPKNENHRRMFDDVWKVLKDAQSVPGKCHSILKETFERAKDQLDRSSRSSEIISPSKFEKKPRKIG